MTGEGGSKPRPGRLARALRWSAAAVVALALAFAALTLATLRPGDPALYPPAAGRPRVAVTVLDHGYHAGLALPRLALAQAAEAGDLPRAAALARRFAAYEAIEVGWGDEGFYRLVPTAADLTLREALRAFFRPGNPTVVHAVGLDRPAREFFPTSGHLALTLSPAGFARLAALLDDTLEDGPDEGLSNLGTGLYGPSLFLRARGFYSAFSTCNHWVGRMLNAAGLPVTPVLDTWSGGLMLDLRWRAAGQGD